MHTLSMLQFGLDSIGVGGVIMVEGITTTMISIFAAPLIQKLVKCSQCTRTYMHARLVILHRGTAGTSVHLDWL